MSIGETPQVSILPINNPFQWIGQKVNAYDSVESGHSEKSFSEDATGSALIRGTRDLVGERLDNRFKFDCRTLKNLGDRFQPGNPVHYGKVFGLKNYYASVGPDSPFQAYGQYFGSEAGRNAFMQDVQDNFKGVKLPTVSLKQYVKDTMIGENASTITKQLSQGRFFFAGSKVLGGILGIVPVIQKTAETKSFKVFVKESVKALMGWEAGILGFIVGRALLPVQGLRIASALIGMAFGSTILKRILD